jgi:carboxylesterase
MVLLRYAKLDRGYSWFPTSVFRHYWHRTQDFDTVLQNVHQPIRIIHSRNDKVADPSGAKHIYDSIHSTDKELIWLEKSGHEILLDAEVPEVLVHIFSSPYCNKMKRLRVNL